MTSEILMVLPRAGSQPQRFIDEDQCDPGEAIASGCYGLQRDDAHHVMWAFGPDGSTVGRFDVKFGIDLHTTSEEQISGRSPCLMCTHEPATVADWARFCDGLEQYYGVRPPSDFISFE